ncbi:kinase-like protein [Trifolium medium]|uniref:Kinase-like protein n=1 Tax=Trifolium medium TaxID=97028 RepID=A0A392R372_9FABA|nr:kinase-like protein [Trifolium medium]
MEHFSSYMYGSNCMNGTYENSFYVDADGYKTLWELGLGDGCRIESMYLTSWPIEHGGGRRRGNNVSCSDIRRKVFYGFELFWINSLCADACMAWSR